MRRSLLAAFVLLSAAGCGTGLPIQLTIDEFTMSIDLSSTVGDMEQELVSGGILPGDLIEIPEIWPTETLPPFRYTTSIQTPPQAIQLNGEKYSELDKVDGAITRIEINRLILRVEQSTLTVALPELEFQIADKSDPGAGVEQEWYTVGIIPSAGVGEVADLDFQWLPGGETFFNSQLGDDERDLAMRMNGDFTYDTEVSPNKPRGQAAIRLIIEVTFFVQAEKLIELVQEL